MLKLDHIVFPVWDAPASLAFYRDVMGFALVDTYSGDDWGGYPWLMMFFAARIRSEIPRWGKIIREANIRPE